MKNFMYALILLTTITLQAQEFYGEAEYESKTVADMPETDNNQELPPDVKAMLQEKLSKALEKKFTLYFNKSASVYKEQAKIENPADKSDIRVEVMTSGGGTHYRNLKEKKQLVETEFFGKEFLVSDSLQKTDWKLEKETRKIGDYTCYKATAVIKPRPLPQEIKAMNLTALPEKDIVLTAWYTPDIPVSHGPGSYWGLPGLILEATDGRTMLLCSKIKLNPKEKYAIKEPSKGKKVGKAEYEKIVVDKTAELQQMNQSGNSRIKVIRAGG